MRVTTVLKRLLGLSRVVVVRSWELVEPATGAGRPKLVVAVRTKAGRRGRCGRCGKISPWFDRGDGERSWRHLDIAFATCELVAEAPRVSCAVHGPTVAEVPWARHDSAFTRAFEDLSSTMPSSGTRRRRPTATASRGGR